jgi:L-arabinose transport system substrate-binding protein
MKLSKSGRLAAALAAAAVLTGAAVLYRTAFPGPHKPTRVKIGFIVKQPEEPWFQNEWKFAEQAGAERGFDIIRVGATDGEQLLNGMESVAAQGGQGVIVCAPDVMIGPAAVAKAKALYLKLMTVDDRFVAADGQPLEGVPHMGISSAAIGAMVGEALVGQLRARGWAPWDTSAMSISYRTLKTAADRNDGVIDVLVREGFPVQRIVDTPQKFPLDVESGYHAAQNAFTMHPDVKHWLIFGINDETVLGGVRAAENRGFGADTVAAIGIGGQATAIVEFDKPQPTAFYATVAISSKRHGYDTALLMYNWIVRGEAPPPATYTAGMLMTRQNKAQILAAMGLAE